MRISRGKKKGPIKAVIYGPEGIGKSTLASKFPEPLFIDVEGGTKQLDTMRVESDYKHWEDITEILIEIDKELNDNPNSFKTIIVDTIDVAETLLSEKIVKDAHSDRIRSLSDFAYGAGQVKLREQINDFLRKLDAIREKHNVHIVLLAHSHLRKCEKPDETGSFDRYELKLNTKVAERIKEWCDILLFVNYKTQIISSQNKMERNKLVGGERVIYTTHHTAWDAKNRFGLPEELPLSYESIKGIFNSGGKAVSEEKALETTPNILDDPDFTEIPDEPEAVRALRLLMERDGITEERIIKALIQIDKAEEGMTLLDLDSKFIRKNLIDKWNSLLGFLKKS